MIQWQSKDGEPARIFLNRVMLAANSLAMLPLAARTGSRIVPVREPGLVKFNGMSSDIGMEFYSRTVGLVLVGMDDIFAESFRHCAPSLTDLHSATAVGNFVYACRRLESSAPLPSAEGGSSPPLSGRRAAVRSRTQSPPPFGSGSRQLRLAVVLPRPWSAVSRNCDYVVDANLDVSVTDVVSSAAPLWLPSSCRFSQINTETTSKQRRVDAPRLPTLARTGESRAVPAAAILEGQRIDFNGR
ncbi:Protein of unknown function [Gryllus bimaculatus]|nr:Protein of unknown function [Gryllus bimaculatus]